ncbi:phage portal protein [Sinorhizobium meliloti]|uniref:phage portal protein n=1 Tax=Rhizobium meliloti TaxID=382 RepID=UPI0023800B33|nr:phage portal protein [Sinorhizobium meliloti]MDE3796976.1 phage portal protein [Sinorhizobium meliloti]
MAIKDWFSRQTAHNAPESRASIENPTVPVSAENFLAFFGVQSANLPNVTIDRALTVPAVWAAVSFLSRTLAALPLHAYRSAKDGPKRISGKLETVVHDAPNDGMDSFKFRQYFWQQVFTGGRGLAWIERTPQGIEALWPMDPSKTVIKRTGMRVVYQLNGIEYPAADVIDVAFMLKSNGVDHYGPIANAAKAIQLAIAMNEYGSAFFAGGGVPPLALSGPLPSGADAMKRASDDVMRAIDAAKKSDKPIFHIPGGHTLEPVGLDPAKGQMIEARRFQVEEIARTYQLPPVFLQDLSRATFTNAEQQDLHLVKHLIGQWAEALEGEMNLKMFGRENRSRYVEHNLDGLLRGDFKTRMEGYGIAIQNAIRTPDEVRLLENLPAKGDEADKLHIQGATVPLGSQNVANASAQKPANDNNQDEAQEAA